MEVLTRRPNKLAKLKRFLRSKNAIAIIAVVGLFGREFVANENAERARELQKHRDLAVSLPLPLTAAADGTCVLDSEADGQPAPAGATRTLLASYPGSGERFTWRVIKALTNKEIADDWNYSQNLEENILTVKSSFPHKAGKWSWGSKMDQVMYLIHNPRYAIPSYHNLLFELDFAGDEASSLARVFNLYTERPPLQDWYTWRDDNYASEMSNWVDHIDFWMQGGLNETTNEIHGRCVNSEIQCAPKAIIDYSALYNVDPGLEFEKIQTVLQASGDVGLISAKARICALDAVWERTDLHSANRNKVGTINAPAYDFTSAQLTNMIQSTTVLKDKYATAPWDVDPVAMQLVVILNAYITSMTVDLHSALQIEIAS